MTNGFALCIIVIERKVIMYATKEYYENKISYLQSKEDKLNEIKKFIEQMNLISSNPSSKYVMEEITKIIESE